MTPSEYREIGDALLKKLKEKNLLTDTSSSLVSNDSILKELGLIISELKEDFDSYKEDQISELKDALLPFHNAIFNDNGDLTINTSINSDDLVKAYFVYKRYR